MKLSSTAMILSAAMLMAAPAFAAPAEYSLNLTAAPDNQYSPYTGTLSGTAVQLFCDDAVDNATIGSSWSVYSTSLAASNSNTRFGEDSTAPGYATAFTDAGVPAPTGTTLYDELAWLFTQLVNNSSNSTIVTSIQNAAWDLTSATCETDAQGTCTGSGNPQLATNTLVWIAAAANDWNKTSGIAALSVDGTTASIVNPNYSDWMILTAPAAVNDPTGGSGQQEMLAYYTSTGDGATSQTQTQSATPEPATFCLFGLAFCGLAIYNRKRLAKA